MRHNDIAERSIQELYKSEYVVHDQTLPNKIHFYNTKLIMSEIW